MNNLLDEVRLMGAAMVGLETANGLVCPKCKGGQHHDKAFSITKTHSHLKFICYRASCGFKGTVDHRSGTYTEGPTKPKQETQVYRGPTERLTETYLADTFGVSDSCVRWAENTKRVLLPVTGIDHTFLGWVARGYKVLGWDGSGPKTINYNHQTDVPFMHFPKEPSDSVVLVEDWVSAEAVGQYHPSCAILGTHLSPEKAHYLASQGIKTLYLAFDEDAWHKYAKVHSQYSLLFDDIVGITWDSGLDPKDMCPEDLKNIFGSL